MKGKKILRMLNSLVTGVLFILLIGVAVLVLSTKLTGGDPQVLGYQIKTVLSGSMEPGIQTGSIIAIETVAEKDKGNFAKGDVITFIEEDEKLITHRITEVNETESGTIYTTKGDNNNAEDTNPVLSENVIGVYKGFTVPYVGYLVNFSQSKNGSIAFMIIPGILMLGYSGFTIWRAIREIDDKTGNKKEKDKLAEAK